MKLNLVYIVYESYEHDDAKTILKAFKTVEGAQKYIELNEKKCSETASLHIESTELGK